MAGLGSFNPSAAERNLQNLAKQTGKGPLAKPPARNIGPLKGGIGPLPPPPAPRAASHATAIGKVPLPKPFEGAARLQSAYKNAPPEKPQAEHRGGGGGLSLGTVLSWAPSAALGPIGIPEHLILQNVGEHTAGTAKAFVKNPGGVAGKTVSSLPGLANSLAMTGIRLGEETGLGAAKKAGFKVPAGTGEPLKAAKEFGTSAIKSTAHTIGENQKEVEQEVGKEGAANQILTYAPVGGGAASVAGRLASKAVEAGGLGAKAFETVKAARDAQIIAHQNPAMHEYLQTPTLSKATRAKAFIHESAAQPRPNLRTAPGAEPVRLEAGAAVRPQTRSPNIFRGMGQTALDNARRAYQLKGLERVAKEHQAFHEMHPETRGDVPVSYSQHLANLTKQGEVTPLFQKGGLRFPGSYFVGATKAQRMGASYPKADLVSAGQNARQTVSAAIGRAMKDLSPEQRKILVLAKEGHFPLHDPVAAQTWLKEISRQAKVGSENGTLIPLVHRMTGSDVGRQVDSVLAHMDKHGPASVITPDFQRLVHAVPDERMVSQKDPLLQQIPDEVAARKYLPQQQTLDAWAAHELTKANPHPDALSTAAAVKQMHELLQRGKDLRDQARHAEGMLHPKQEKFGATPKKDAGLAEDLHAQADNAFAHAKNLADENAKRHGLPTDRAYIKHQRSRGAENWLHTVGRRAPSDAKQWRSVLQRQGYRSTDPRLIEDSMLKSIRNKLAVEHISNFDQRFAVPNVPNNLTAQQAHDWMLRQGLNPDHYEVAHLGKVFQGIQERQVGGADMLHLDLNPVDHGKAMGELVQQARGVHPGDSTKGASVYPTTALHELQGALSQSGLVGRAYGKVKGSFSSLMLGTSPAWASTMGLITYPSQALMGGAAPWEAWRLGPGGKLYDRLGEGAKREFDLATGTDNPFRSTHEAATEKIGSTGRMLGKPPAHIEDLINTMKLWSSSPLGRLMHNSRPDRIVLKLERVPRRYARIGVAMKHAKGMALDNMLRESKGLYAAQSSLQKAMIHLQHLGRMPSDQYMQEILKSRPAMEDVAQRTQVVMGEWKKMTNFERNVASKIPLFYPWVRYSLRLAAKSLPANHPLMYGFAGQLATLSQAHLRELLGTDTPTGKAPIGRAQPNLEPAERKWLWAGAPQADPLLNAISDLLSAKPSRTVGALPPFVAAPIEWAVNRNSFTDKPLKVSQPYVRGQQKEEERPPFGSTMMAKLLEATAPGRAAQDITAKGRPQAANSLLGSAPMHYSPRTEQSIEEEAEQKGKRSTYEKVGKYVFPLLPHREPGLLNAKLKEEEKQRKKEEVASGGW